VKNNIPFFDTSWVLFLTGCLLG